MPDIKKRPNLLFIFPDEFRAQSMGFMEQDPVMTPNIDNLAAEGLVLRDVVSNYPVCTPYRGMLMTGKYPFASGLTSNCNSTNNRYGVWLKQEEICFSDVLNAAGYETGYVGKWHLDPPEEPYEYLEPRRNNGVIWDAFTSRERRHGFRFWHSYGCCDNHNEPHYWSGDRVEDRIDVSQWSTEYEADIISEYLLNKGNEKRDRNKPFALFWSPNPPHMPFHMVPDRYKKMYESYSQEELLARVNVQEKTAQLERDARNYFAMITGVDDQIGRVLQTLETAGLAEDTIVIFTSDHGEMMGSHGRMGKSVWYEESMVVPFIIRWKGVIEPGERRLMLSAPDLMPSILSLLGCGDRIPSGVQGENYAKAILGEDGPRPDAALYMQLNPGDWSQGSRGLRTERYTFVIAGQDDQEVRLLFDNVEDPYQLENRFEQLPDVADELEAEMRMRLQRIGDPRYTK
ncbi:sulfatase [Paenibacillus sp. GCM10012303]|uniref:sulfatase family protein n=1 Tax=Paenibacillus sp. GCM10012303 TaxID=3317340 RepID=UPI0036103BFC